MNFQRSALLLFLAFAVGFVGWLLIGFVQDQWPQHFSDRSAMLLFILAVLWGTPRGVLEHKTFEVLAGIAIMFVGIEIAFWYPWVTEDPGSMAVEPRAFWTGRALFVAPEECVSFVVVSAPDGGRVSVSYQPVEGTRTGDSYSVPDVRRLWNSFLVAGKHAEERVTVGEATVLIAVGGILAPGCVAPGCVAPVSNR